MKTVVVLMFLTAGVNSCGDASHFYTKLTFESLEGCEEAAKMLSVHEEIEEVKCEVTHEY